MIKAIIDSIAVLIHAAFPDHAIYDEGQVPQNFIRPSFCIVTGGVKHTPLNIRLTKHEITVTIFSFPPLSESMAAHLPDLQETLAGLCAVFRKGYIKVGNRAVKVLGGIKSDCSEQDGYVEMTLYYTDSAEEQTTDVMQNIHIN